ncbi:MAG: hypothetical protein FD177_19 [Desulfovibrionaceae bacterium]|nr:MAG: hypothetical protein FD177_19 [Desulfovibrionaceae bacterium]
MNRNFLRLVILISVLCAVHGTAYALPITITNYSFENPDPGDPGSWTQGIPIPGWSSTDDNMTGVINAGPTSGFGNTASVGENAAWVQGVNSIWQILTAPLLANHEYTLSVDVGNRSGSFWTLNPIIELRSNQTVLKSQGISVLPDDGTFGTINLVYQSGNFVPLGEFLGIALLNTGDFWTQSHFDNVRLDATALGSPTAATPEPGTMMLMGIGVAVAAFMRRRKMKDA